MIITQFYNFYFIVAATVGFISMHSASAADIRSFPVVLNGVQFIHAIMQIDNHPAADGEIGKCYYECDSFFHLNYCIAKITIMLTNYNNCKIKQKNSGFLSIN